MYIYIYIRNWQSCIIPIEYNYDFNQKSVQIVNLCLNNAIIYIVSALQTARFYNIIIYIYLTDLIYKTPYLFNDFLIRYKYIVVYYIKLNYQHFVIYLNLKRKNIYHLLTISVCLVMHFTPFVFEISK